MMLVYENSVQHRNCTYMFVTLKYSESQKRKWVYELVQNDYIQWL